MTAGRVLLPVHGRYIRAWARTVHAEVKGRSETFDPNKSSSLEYYRKQEGAMAVSAVRLVFYITLAYKLVAIGLWDPARRPLTGLTDVVYDYVVVGAGSAGCVLAARLSEDPNATVLLVEAGGADLASEIQIPFAASRLRHTAVDWAHLTLPQKAACYGTTAQKAAWPAGKVLGGSSSINSLTYVRGNKADYDQWERMGASGWGYEDVLPYFIKSEDFHGEAFDAGYHGFDGALTVESAKFRTPVARAFVESGREMGYETVDYNGESQIGFGYFQRTTSNSARCSSAKAFLHPVRHRPNLFVAAGKAVRSLRLQSSDRVEGVLVVEADEYERGPEMLVRANKEVILSAGTIHSPHILMVSGIGPEEHLRSARLNCVKDLPVGEHMQDHLAVVLPFVLEDAAPDSGVSLTEPLADLPASLLEYLLLGSGPLSSSPAEATAFLHSGLEPEGQGPDIQVRFEGGVMTTRDLKNAHFTTEGMVRLWGYDLLQDKPVAGYSLLPTLLHPRSVGSVQLDTIRSPLEPPFINPNYLDSSDDVEVLLRAVRIAQKIVKSRSFTSWHGRPLYELSKGPFQFDTDEFWRWYIPRLPLSLNHPTGTCKMGAVDDPTTVVDPRLRVKGFRNLRVVDASVMPEIVSGDTNAPVIMIAEKAADMIKQDNA